MKVIVVCYDITGSCRGDACVAPTSRVRYISVLEGLQKQQYHVRESE